MIAFEELVAVAKQTASELGITQYELYLSENEDIGAETFRQEIDHCSFGVSAYLSVRVFLDGKAGSASSGLVSTEIVKQLLTAAKENMEVISGGEKEFFYEGGGVYKEIPPCHYGDLPEMKCLKEAALDLCSAVYSADDGVQDGTACAAWAGKHRMCLYNSTGITLTREGGSDGVYTYAVMADGDKRQGGHKSHPSMETYDAKKLAETAITKAKSRFGATVPDTGVYNLVFEGKQMEAILSTYISVFYGERSARGLSPLTVKDLETAIASDKVTFIDDPFMEGNAYQINFDGEGVPTYTKTVVDKGVFKMFLHNLKSADMMHTVTTGNAARQGGHIGTKVFNFRMEKGEYSREDLFKMAGDGSIFITEMKGFHAGANVVTGDFSIESGGFLIEDGKQGKALKAFTVAGNFFDLLKKVIALGNEYDERGPGYTRHLCPDVLVKDMQVAGK